MDSPDMDEYFAGTRLYGDDFGPEEIAAWYADEKEGYATLGRKDRASYVYAYHALNVRHGFRFLAGRRFQHALGLGSAFGDEFLPIVKRVERVTILDPSDAFRADHVGGVPCQWLQPSVDGRMAFPNDSFDLITCLGVLHHIPNVTTVVNELCRCLCPGGFLLLREPIVSMGDWTKPRRTATIRERGIPLAILCRIVHEAGLQVVSQRLCVFPPIARIWRRFGRSAYNSGVATRIDEVLCRWFGQRTRYHATRRGHKIRPTSAYFVLSK
jgi:SAM-dependent methyltransferase